MKAMTWWLYTKEALIPFFRFLFSVFNKEKWADFFFLFQLENGGKGTSFRFHFQISSMHYGADISLEHTVVFSKKKKLLQTTSMNSKFRFLSLKTIFNKTKSAIC